MTASSVSLRRLGRKPRHVDENLSESPRELRRCRRLFLRFFPAGFRDERYLAWERDYKWAAHEQWLEVLDRDAFYSRLRARAFADIAADAIRIESRTNLLFSFEKMALRDAVKSPDGARTFATALFELLHGERILAARFTHWCEAIESLPRKQTRVSTWPIATVFGFIAQPDVHVYLKPKATRTAAERLAFDLQYRSRPSWETYASLLELAATVRRQLHDLRPRDMIDVQSFLWVVGSDEYASMTP